MQQVRNECSHGAPGAETKRPNKCSPRCHGPQSAMLSPAPARLCSFLTAGRAAQPESYCGWAGGEAKAEAPRWQELPVGWASTCGARDCKQVLTQTLRFLVILFLGGPHPLVKRGETGSPTNAGAFLGTAANPAFGGRPACRGSQMAAGVATCLAHIERRAKIATFQMQPTSRGDPTPTGANPPRSNWPTAFPATCPGYAPGGAKDRKRCACYNAGLTTTTKRPAK